MIASIVQAKFEERKVLLGASLTGSYQALGTLLNPSRIFVLYNGAAAAIDVSFDGTTDHTYLPIGSNMTIDIATNKQTVFSDGTWYVPKGTIVYVKTSSLLAPIVLTSFYG